MKDFAEFRKTIIESGKLDAWNEQAEKDLKEALDKDYAEDPAAWFFIYIKSFGVKATFYLLEEYHKWLNES